MNETSHLNAGAKTGSTASADSGNDARTQSLYNRIRMPNGALSTTGTGAFHEELAEGAVEGFRFVRANHASPCEGKLLR